MNSTHTATIVPVVLAPHPNADSLSLVFVWGYQCVVRTDDWRGRDRGVFIPDDTLVDTKRTEFAFLAPRARADGKYRVKPMKLRGQLSQGLLLPTEAPLGTDLYAALGCERYEPEEQGSPTSRADTFLNLGELAPAPSLLTGPEKYDIDAWERHANRFVDGEQVFIQEKLDGSNCRVVWWDGDLHVKSRKRWLRRVPDYSHVTVEALVEKGWGEADALGIVARLPKPVTNSFWRVIEQTPELLAYLRANPGTTVYGEVYGTTNRIKYGENKFAAFDVFRDGKFLPASYVYELGKAGVPVAPWEVESYSDDCVRRFRSGPSASSSRAPFREGVVIRPTDDRCVPGLGRLIVKAVNPDFLAKGE